MRPGFRRNTHTHGEDGRMEGERHGGVAGGRGEEGEEKEGRAIFQYTSKKNQLCTYVPTGLQKQERGRV